MRYLLPLGFLFLFGCANPQTVSRAQLAQLRKERHEPKVSRWYYIGSRDGYDYLHHDALGDAPKDFRIAEKQIPLPERFPLSRRRVTWRLLD